MPFCKLIRAKWVKTIGRSRTPEPQRRQGEVIHRPASAPPPTTATDRIPSQPVIQLTVEQTPPLTSRTSENTPHAPTESSSSSAKNSISNVTGGPPPRTRSDPHETTIQGSTVSTNATHDEHGEGLESRPKVTKEGHSNTRDTVKGAVRLALEVTESLSEGVPFLPGVVKALKTVVEAYEVRRSRSKASPWPFVELRHLIDSAHVLCVYHRNMLQIWNPWTRCENTSNL